MSCGLVVGCGSSAEPPSASARFAEFERLAQESFSDGNAAELFGYFRSLAPRERVEVAREAAAHGRTAIQTLAVSLLVKVRDEPEAVKTMAHLVAGGADVSGLYWQLLHSEDPGAADRLINGVHRYFATHADEFDATERERIQKILGTNNSNSK